MFVNTAFSINDYGVQQVIDAPKVITHGIGTSVVLGCEMFGATAGIFPLGVGNDIRFWHQQSQFDPRLAIGAVFWRSGFPFSGKIVLDLLPEFLAIFFVSSPQ